MWVWVLPISTTDKFFFYKNIPRANWILKYQCLPTHSPACFLSNLCRHQQHVVSVQRRFDWNLRRFAAEAEDVESWMDETMEKQNMVKLNKKGTKVVINQDILIILYHIVT